MISIERTCIPSMDAWEYNSKLTLTDLVLLDESIHCKHLLEGHLRYAEHSVRGTRGHE